MAFTFGAKNQSRHCGGSDPSAKLSLTPVVIMVVILIVVMILVATLVAIAVMIAVAWRLELSILAQVTISGQYLPLVSSTRLQPSQLQGMMGASARMVG
jgi:hypothetical protein